jgi:hypothetical protein
MSNKEKKAPEIRPAEAEYKKNRGVFEFNNLLQYIDLNLRPGARHAPI